MFRLATRKKFHSDKRMGWKEIPSPRVNIGFRNRENGGVVDFVVVPRVRVRDGRLPPRAVGEADRQHRHGRPRPLHPLRRVLLRAPLRLRLRQRRTPRLVRIIGRAPFDIFEFPNPNLRKSEKTVRNSDFCCKKSK